MSFLVQILHWKDLVWLAIDSALSKKSRFAPKVFRAGHKGDMTDTENRARKASGTQGIRAFASDQENEVSGVENGCNVRNFFFPWSNFKTNFVFGLVWLDCRLRLLEYFFRVFF